MITKNNYTRMIDVVKIFEDKAKADEKKFSYGARMFQSYQVGELQLAPNEEVIIMFPCRETPQIENGYWSRYRIETQIWMCRKSEDDTYSYIGETEEAKYKARLLNLSHQLDEYLKAIFYCNTEYQLNMISISYFRELNQLSTSIDGASATITFDIWQ